MRRAERQSKRLILLEVLIVRVAIGSYSITRRGDIVGDHFVLFLATGSSLEISIEAHSRQHFASGAMLATRFIIKHRLGYSMDDLMASMSVS